MATKIRRKAAGTKRAVESYEVTMPVYKAGSHLEGAGARAPGHARDTTALAIAAGDWAEGAAILLRLHLCFADRQAQCDQAGLPMDITVEGDGHSIVVTGPARSLKPILRDRLLRDALVALDTEVHP